MLMYFRRDEEDAANLTVLNAKEKGATMDSFFHAKKANY